MDHLTNENCPCNPQVIPVKREDGTIGWVYMHRRLSDDK